MIGSSNCKCRDLVTEEQPGLIVPGQSEFEYGIWISACNDIFLVASLGWHLFTDVKQLTTHTTHAAISGLTCPNGHRVLASVCAIAPTPRPTWIPVSWLDGTEPRF